MTTLSRYLLVFVGLAAANVIAGCAHGKDRVAQGVLGQVTIGSLKQGVTRQSEADNRPDFCAGFSLTREQIARYLAVAQQVPAIEFYGNQVWLPCFIVADIRVGDQSGKLTISASFAARAVFDDGREVLLVCEEACQKGVDWK